jgi:hypothetical protein
MAPNPFHGEITFDMMEQEQAAILEGENETDPSDLDPIYDRLCAERDRRAASKKAITNRTTVCGSGLQ